MEFVVFAPVFAFFAPATDRRVDLRGNICREDGVM